MIRRAILAPALAALLGAAAPPVSFTPMSPEHAEAAGEYRRLWQAEGDRIVAAMEAATGLAFPPARVDAIVSEGRPMASFDGRTIRLRASYSHAYKKATLAHEIGHRLAFTLPHAAGLDDHRLLYLFLYDVWTDLYGRDFADRMVGIERRIGAAYDEAWTWALAMTREERLEKLKSLIDPARTPTTVPPAHDQVPNPSLKERRPLLSLRNVISSRARSRTATAQHTYFADQAKSGLSNGRANGPAGRRGRTRKDQVWLHQTGGVTDCERLLPPFRLLY
ncbi:MAG: hypothetical protein ACXWU4_05610 [Allosphingosinicella sp.]